MVKFLQSQQKDVNSVPLACETVTCVLTLMDSLHSLLLRPVFSNKLMVQGKEGTSGGPRGVWAWQLGNNPSVS